MNHSSVAHLLNPAGLFPIPASQGVNEIGVQRSSGQHQIPPYALLEGQSDYSIVFNMLGLERKCIGIDVNVTKREVTVLAKRDRETSVSRFFWVFGVPADALMSEITARLKGGALEIAIPKQFMAIGA